METKDIRAGQFLEEGTPLLHNDGLVYNLSSSYLIPKVSSFGAAPSNMVLRVERKRDGKKFHTQDLLKNFVGIVINETPTGKIFDRRGKEITVSIIR